MSGLKNYKLPSQIFRMVGTGTNVYMNVGAQNLKTKVKVETIDLRYH